MALHFKMTFIIFPATIIAVSFMSMQMLLPQVITSCLRVIYLPSLLDLPLCSSGNIRAGETDSDNIILVQILRSQSGKLSPGHEATMYVIWTFVRSRVDDRHISRFMKSCGIDGCLRRLRFQKYSHFYGSSRRRVQFQRI